jgi:O-antigen ligase
MSISCLYFTAFASLLSASANTIGLYVAMPIAFLLSTLTNKGFHTTIYEKIVYTLFAWDAIAYLWANDKELAASELHAVLGAFMLVYILCIQARDPKKIPLLYGVYIMLYLSAWNYAIHHILTIMVNGDRLNDEHLNANTLAYYTFYVSFLTFMLAEITKTSFMKKAWKIVFWLMLPFSFLVSLLTASRQVLLIQIPLYALLIYIEYIKGVSTKNKILFTLFAILIAGVLAGPIYNTYEDSNLKERADMSVADDPRIELLFDATNVAINNLPLGVGSGNYQAVSSRRQISHNSYLEAFVNLGVVGLALYVSLMGVFVIRQWRRYKKYNDKMYFAFFTFGIIYSLDGIFFVFWNSIWLISFFMLVTSHSETYVRYHHASEDIETEKVNILEIRHNY